MVIPHPQCSLEPYQNAQKISEVPKLAPGKAAHLLNQSQGMDCQVVQLLSHVKYSAIRTTRLLACIHENNIGIKPSQNGRTQQ